MTTKKQVIDDLSRFVAKCPERKIVCLVDDGTPLFYDCVELNDWDEPWQYILTIDEDKTFEMTVAHLLECLTENHPDDPDPEGEEAEVVVRIYDDGDEYLKYLDDSAGAIFFEYTVGDEKVMAFRCGDEAETKYDFFDDVN